MKLKLINGAILLSSLIGYLEWGGGHSGFLFQAEAELFRVFMKNPTEALHPFTVIPIIGQILLLIACFQNPPRKIISYLGIGCIAFLLIFMLFVGLLGQNIRIVISVLPFITACVVMIVQLKRLPSRNPKQLIKQ